MTVHQEPAGWVKSSFSNQHNCVEFRYTDSEWKAFVAGVKAGEFDI